MEQVNNDIELNDNLNADKFKIVFQQLKGVEILCKTAPIPSITGNSIPITNPYSSYHVQGTKLEYEPLTIGFLVDRNLVSYRQVHEWMTSIHAPQDSQQYKEFIEKRARDLPSGNRFSVDASLFSLTNSMNANIEFVFRNIFPTSLSSIDFNVEGSPNNNVIATATFQYDYFTINTKKL